MRRRLPLQLVIVFVITIFAAASVHAGTVPEKHRGTRKTSANSDMPLAVFQRVDKQLTVIDADNQALRMKRKQVSDVRAPSRRKRMLRQVQRSLQSRERLRAVNQLLAISSRAERIYRARHQQYGSRLFRDLHARIAALKKPILKAQTAATTTAFDRDESLVDARLLWVVRQFQTISGGYAALSCRPGTWACCRPRTTRDGKLEVHGCTWSCASKLAACRGGCLGPRIPNTVVAVRNTAPKLHPNGQRQALAGNQPRKSKPADRATVTASRQVTPTGNE
ncbi:MAG TPA: hypothetical protein VM912_11885 [Terriglobales bacterium]|nr:hypothetical protein [Terriglobales bacterium]